MSETDAAAPPSAECVPALPRDAVAEILARVPPDVSFLFRCSVVCKLWCHLLTDPVILRRLLPAEIDRPSILGFFAERLLPSITDQTKEKQNIPVLPAGAPVFVPAPICALGPAHRSLTSFVRDDFGVLDRAEPLAAHDGLLLLRVSPRSTDDRNVLRLSVCNLLTGKLDVLPPLNTFLLDGKGVRGYAVLSAADQGAAAAVPHRPADGYSTFFQVLLIAVNQIDKQLYLHRFSSAAAAASGASRDWIVTPTNFFPHERNWRAPVTTNCFRQDRNTDCFRQRQRHFSLGCLAATVCYGTAHWLFECEGILYIHHVSVNTGCLCTTRILIDVFFWFNARLCLSTDGRRLSFVYTRDDCLVIWTQSDGDPDYSCGWILDAVIQVNMNRKCSRVNSLATVCFGEKSGTVFVIYDSDPDSAYLVDLRSRFPSRSMTMVTSWNESFDHMTAVPYEFNWHMFFMSRLGTRL